MTRERELAPIRLLELIKKTNPSWLALAARLAKQFCHAGADRHPALVDLRSPPPALTYVRNLAGHFYSEPIRRTCSPPTYVMGGTEVGGVVMPGSVERMLEACCSWTNFWRTEPTG